MLPSIEFCADALDAMPVGAMRRGHDVVVSLDDDVPPVVMPGLDVIGGRCRWARGRGFHHIPSGQVCRIDCAVGLRLRRIALGRRSDQMPWMLTKTRETTRVKTPLSQGARRHPRCRYGQAMSGRRRTRALRPLRRCREFRWRAIPSASLTCATSSLSTRRRLASVCGTSVPAR